MKRESTDTGYCCSAGVWFAVGMSVMFLRDSPDWDIWWLKLILIFIAMLLFSFSFYAFTQAITSRVIKLSREAMQVEMHRQANWRDDRR